MLGVLMWSSRKDRERKWSLYRDLDSGWRKVRCCDIKKSKLSGRSEYLQIGEGFPLSEVTNEMDQARAGIILVGIGTLDGEKSFKLEHEFYCKGRFDFQGTTKHETL
jgi:hypothetical protein